MAKFIQLTFFNSQRTHGTAGGNTNKKFFQRVDQIMRMIPYDHSTKIEFLNPAHKIIEVQESVIEIIQLIKGK